jgi:hypothetical protein
VRRPPDLQVLEFRCHARRHDVDQRAERRSGTPARTGAVANARATHLHPAENRTQLSLMAALDAQLCIADIASRVRRRNGRTLSADQVLLRAAGRVNDFETPSGQ